MEENNLINNDNTYNTDMSTSQSTIGGNETTNNKFNKDDLQEVAGGGGGVITPPVVSEDNDIEQQASGTLTPILLILSDVTTTDEEPVLLEEDTTYKAVINSDYEYNIPTIKFESNQQSYSNSNYVIAVTELDKNTPINYDSTNLSVSFTNNENNWCSVIFKSPLEVADQLKLPLNSDNFPDNSKIIVPVIKCTKNTGPERNTIITFNIKNLAILHNIQMNVIQSAAVPGKELKPIMLYYDNGNYKKLVDCPPEFILTEHNDAITDSSLQVREIKQLIDDKVTYIYGISTGPGIMIGTPKDVYLGYEDTNKIFEGNLSSVMTGLRATLESDVTGCSAKLSRADTTGASIKYSLNKCTADRIITFSYKNTPIFKINQTYDNSGSSTTKSYKIYVCKVGGTALNYNNGFALFDINNPLTFSIQTYGNQIYAFMPFFRNQNIFVLVYTEEKMPMYNVDKIGTLLKNGQLRHLYGHNDLTKSDYKDLYLDNVNLVNHFEQVGIGNGNGTFSTTEITRDMDIYVYIEQQDAYVISPTYTFNFNNLESDNHLGVYELRSTI